jgi:putative N-acetylmannosamine-6-phosphate epimerase
MARNLILLAWPASEQAGSVYSIQIVSCQADEGDAFYGMMDRFARAAVAGGAGGIRANGPSDIAAIHAALALPIIGIQKVLHEDGNILITQSFEAVAALVSEIGLCSKMDRVKAEGIWVRRRVYKGDIGEPKQSDRIGAPH